jgi:hypothetical protein
MEGWPAQGPTWWIDEMVALHPPKLVFQHPFDEAAAYEAEVRGYLGYAAVELSDGTRYPVVFYDPVRLQQDLEVEAGEGRAFIAEPGMIVIPEVTLGRMQDAIERLFQNGFFDSLRSEPEQGRKRRPETGREAVPDEGTGNGAAAPLSHPASLSNPRPPL